MVVDERRAKMQLHVGTIERRIGLDEAAPPEPPPTMM